MRSLVVMCFPCLWGISVTSKYTVNDQLVQGICCMALTWGCPGATTWGNATIPNAGWLTVITPHDVSSIHTATDTQPTEVEVSTLSGAWRKTRYVSSVHCFLQCWVREDFPSQNGSYQGRHPHNPGVPSPIAPQGRSGAINPTNTRSWPGHPTVGGCGPSRGLLGASPWRLKRTGVRQPAPPFS